MTKDSSIHAWISTKVHVSQNQVASAVELMEQACTIPFIARYRKEMTGNLDEVELERIHKALTQYKELQKRKETILKSIEEQGKLTEALRQQIEGCNDITTLEDLYLPFKSRKETKADKARKVGLEPLAKIIMSQEVRDLNATVTRFLTNEVISEELALEGARNIIAEWMNERQGLRDMLRKELRYKGVLSSKLVKGKAEDGENYSDYFEWEEPLKKVPAHRFLAMARGEKEGVLRLKVVLPKEEIVERIARFFIRKSNEETAEQIELAAKDAWTRLLLPALENEVMREQKEMADSKSIDVFSENLKQLLLAAPLGEKKVLAIDPGFRTGCKVVCLDETGKLLHNETIYPHPPKSEYKLAAKKISTLVSAYKIEAIAIGNGTAGRETDQFIKSLVFDRTVHSFMVNENGASIYSASKIAREEFPDYDVTVRGAVSIGRRLMDPLAELVKIDPKSIGVGQYQHDVDQKMLQDSLDRVVEYSVNKVGVNLNTASKHLLQYISGLGPKLAETLVQYREEKGAFKNREEIRAVRGMGAKAFQQSAGFLRVYDGDNSLDETGIHPERYEVVEKIIKEFGREKIKELDFKQFENNEIGYLTLEDIKQELLKPRRDPREKRKAFSFDPSIKKIEDLKIGMHVPGLVTNITNFGAFVDIGVKQDGLVHISKMANRFVSDPNEIVKLGQAVNVKVVEIDMQRSRIQLSMNE